MDELEESTLNSLMDEGQDDSISGSELDVPPVDESFDVSKNLECSYCAKAFTTRRELLVHQWTHKERQEYVCQVCDKPISNENAFRKHMVMHFKDYSRHVRCKICQKVFRTPRAMEEHHEKYHRGQKPFVCTTCGLSFSWRDNLFKHERVHVEKPFACLVCHESFRDVAALNKHIKQHRLAQKSNNPSDTTKMMLGLMPKQQELHYRPLLTTNGSQSLPDDDNDDKEFKCSVCGMSFMYNFTLEAHMKGHGDEKIAAVVTESKKKATSKVDKPHACPICGEKFRWDFCLNAHLKIHQQKKVGGQVFFGSNRVPKPVEGSAPRFKNIPSSKKLLMLVNSSAGLNDTKTKPIATLAPSQQQVKPSAPAAPSKFLPISPTPSISSHISPQKSPVGVPSLQQKQTEPTLPAPRPPDDLEPGEIRLDHLIDMAVDEDNWEPMVPKPDPGLPIVQQDDAAKAKKKARMIRVEQVPLEGRKKQTVVKKLGGSDDEKSEDETDKDEPVVTSFVAAKSKRGRAQNSSPIAPVIVPAITPVIEQEEQENRDVEFDELMNLTESESESGSDFESELKGRKKTKRKVPKRKIKTEKVEEDDSPPPPKSRRGRPRREIAGSKQGAKPNQDDARDNNGEASTHRRRPTRNRQPSPEVSVSPSPPPVKRRGRPPKIKEEKSERDSSPHVPAQAESRRATRNSMKSRKARMEADAQIQKIIKEDNQESEEECPTVLSPPSKKKQQTKPETFAIAKVSKLKVYSCDLCKKAFTKRTALLAHRLFAHKGVKRSALQHTGIEMIQHRALMNKADHLIRRAGARQSQVRPYECMECGKSFSQQAYLTFHEERHDNISRTYTCHQCDLTMYSWLQCIQHQMLHRKSAR